MCPRAGRAETAKYVVFDWPWSERVRDIYIYIRVNEVNTRAPAL
jgi:hypothetical protein